MIVFGRAFSRPRRRYAQSIVYLYLSTQCIQFKERAGNKHLIPLFSSPPNLQKQHPTVENSPLSRVSLRIASADENSPFHLGYSPIGRPASLVADWPSFSRRPAHS